MQRGLTKLWSWRVTAMVAATTALSCGTGIRDGDGEVYMFKTIDAPGDRLVLGEATLDVGEGCLDSPTVITLRRFSTIDHTGAIGPVFELQVPTPGTFKGDPRIEISTSDTVAAASSSTIGFLVPGGSNEQWVPDTPQPAPPCSSGVVCGPVQIKSFTEPGGTTSPLPPTTRLEFAIVTQCQEDQDCPLYQACSSRACQECYPGSTCNYPSS